MFLFFCCWPKEGLTLNCHTGKHVCHFFFFFDVAVIPSTGFRSQFTKMSQSAINSRGVGYDYDSVMHYHSTAFGNGRITITREDGSTKLGNTRGLSPKDIEQARKMYCGSTPTNRPVTQRPPRPSTPPSGKCPFSAAFADSVICKTF